MANQQTSSRRGRKIAAIAAGALAVGLGATYTLASWTDSEWVWGGAAGDAPGIGTSTFEVEQFTEGSWHDDESNPGGALDFTTAALALAPDDTVYAPVSLRTKIGSIGGEVTLTGAVAATGIAITDPDGELWDAVELTVHTSDEATAPACTAVEFDAVDWSSVAGLSGASLGASATAAQTLGAATTSVAGDPQHYCFVIHLPANAQTIAEGDGVNLMGRTIAPAWRFAAVSD